MRIDRHVYGSISGYETLARSPGVSDVEQRTLERVSIGQSYDPSFFNSLASLPAYVITPIGGRVALTRIVPGPRDDKGRPVIQRVSVILSRQDWDGPLNGDPLALASRPELWEWSPGQGLETIELTLGRQSPLVVPEHSATKLLDLISLLEVHASGKPVIVREGNLSLQEFVWLEMLVPVAVRPRHGAIYRCLRTDAPAAFICLAGQASVSASVETYRNGAAVPRSPYASVLEDAGLATGTIPLDFVKTYRSFGMAGPQLGARAPASRGPQIAPPVIIERTPRGLIGVLIAACVVLPLLSGFLSHIWTAQKDRLTVGESIKRISSLELIVTNKDARTTLNEELGKLASFSRQDIRSNLEKMMHLDSLGEFGTLAFLQNLQGASNPPSCYSGLKAGVQNVVNEAVVSPRAEANDIINKVNEAMSSAITKLRDGSLAPSRFLEAIGSITTAMNQATRNLPGVQLNENAVSQLKSKLDSQTDQIHIALTELEKGNSNASSIQKAQELFEKGSAEYRLWGAAKKQMEPTPQTDREIVISRLKKIQTDLASANSAKTNAAKADVFAQAVAVLENLDPDSKGALQKAINTLEHWKPAEAVGDKKEKGLVGRPYDANCIAELIQNFKNPQLQLKESSPKR